MFDVHTELNIVLQNLDSTVYSVELKTFNVEIHIHVGLIDTVMRPQVHNCPTGMQNVTVQHVVSSQTGMCWLFTSAQCVKGIGFCFLCTDTF